MSKVNTTILLGFIVVICCMLRNSEAVVGDDGNVENADTQSVAEDQAPVDWKDSIAALCEVFDRVTNSNKTPEVEACIKEKTALKEIHECLNKMILDYYYPIINTAKFYKEKEETAQTRAWLKDGTARYTLLILQEKLTVEEAPEYDILNDIANDFDRNTIKTTEPVIVQKEVDSHDGKRSAH